MTADPVPAETALISVLRGDVEAGFALYRRLFQGDTLTSVPAGLHVGMLERAGRTAEAERLKALAVELGGDLATRAGSFLGADPEGAAAEYEALLANGTVNSRMIHEYSKVLATLGRMDRLASLLAPGLLFHTQVLDRTFAEAVDAMLLEMEDEAERQDAVQSVRNMRMVKELQNLDHPVARALVARIEDATRGYLDRWRASDHAVARLVPEEFEIDAWGLISRGEGYNIPHIHAYGWATGVFYPRTVQVGGGEIVIGRPASSAGEDEDWGGRRVKPEAGLLILMPSFYTHWTEPLERPGLRTSVAFDVRPLPSGA